LPTIRPVGHDERLSLVEHLDELRTRLIFCVLAFVVSFGICYSQNNRILDWLNQPLADAHHVNCENPRKAAAPLERSGCFNEAVGVYLREAAPALTQAARTLSTLGDGDGVAAADSAQAQRAARALRATAAQALRAAALTPKASQNTAQPVTLGVTEPFLSTVTVAAYAALLLAMPFLLFQAYAFVLPAFSRDERRLALPVMMLVPALFIAGVAFAYFLAVPRAVSFLQNYNDGQYDILVQAKDYYRFVVMLLVAMGLLFQIPVGILAIVRLQIMSVRQLRKSRGYALILFAVIAAIVTPTPDPFTMLIAMAPLVVLYEVSILLARLFEPKGPSRWSFGWDDDEEEDEEEDEDEEEGRPRPAPDPPATAARVDHVPLDERDEDLD
jgi:sec-independent protein translocase protein TatC